MDSRGYTARLISANKAADRRHPGVKLGRYCIANNISVRDIAARFGVSRATVYKWFTGEWHPRGAHVEKINAFVDG